jgi:hypothetical protein
MAVFALNSTVWAGLPLSAFAGAYAFTFDGGWAVCLNSSFNEVACNDASVAFVFPEAARQVGVETLDANGNGCSTSTVTVSDNPLDASPPFVLTQIGVTKTTAYDAATGTGTTEGTAYEGGKCNGAVFDSSGATEVSTFTLNFVVVRSADGGVASIKSILTSISDAPGNHGVSGFGDFFGTSNSIKQSGRSQNNQ